MDSNQINQNADNEERVPSVSQSNASAANINDEDNPSRVAGAAGPINESMLNRPKNNPLTSASSSIVDATKQAQNLQHYQSAKDLAQVQEGGEHPNIYQMNNISQQSDLRASMIQEDQIQRNNSSVVIANESDRLNYKEVAVRPRADTALSASGFGAPSPYNVANSKLKTMSGYGLSQLGAGNPFGHKSMNAIVPSSSFMKQFAEQKGGAGDQMSFKRNAARSLRHKQRKAEATILEHKRDMLEIRNLLSERTEKMKKLGQQLQFNNDGDKWCQRCLFKSFPCFSKCFPSFNYQQHYTVNLRVETITCNKLSHCLFDFDCPDFNAQYENEKYEHHVFKTKNLISNANEPKILSLLDQQFQRDDMMVTVRDVNFNKTNYLQVTKNKNDQMTVDLPFSKEKDNNKDNFIFRIVFKADSGDLWGFNKFECDKSHFEEAEYLQLLNQGQLQSTSASRGEHQVPDGTHGQVSATLDDIGMNDMSHIDAATHRHGERKDTNYLNESAFDQIHSRLNILDDQVTVNYDLSQPTIQRGEDEEGDKKKVKRKLTKRQKIARRNNFRELTQEEIDQEIEFENSVDLDKTMWLVMRDKRSVNNILKRFETRNQLHHLKVNDIVKFGRVNFKVSIIKSDKLVSNIQGGYYLLEKKNQEIQEQLEKIQNLQTEQQTQADVDGPGKIPLAFGKNHLDNELISRQHIKSTGQIQTKNLSNDQAMFEPPTPTLNRDPTRHGDFGEERLPTQENGGADFALGVLDQNSRDLSRNDGARTRFGFHEDMDDSRTQLQNVYGNMNINEPQNWAPSQKGSRGLGVNPRMFADDESIRSSVSKMSSAMISSKRSVRKDEHGEVVCRICLGTEDEGTPDEDGQPDKLICPCKCAGSMGMIHISCLKEWVNGKRLVYKGRKVQSFFWKALECELCNEAFENRMKYRMFQIMKIDLPNDGQDYMIFESIKSAPAKVIHVFDLSKCKPNASLEEPVKENEFRVGRSVETDMRIADISVSRVHSFIRIVGNQLVLQDNGSKFGTLVKVIKPQKILQLTDPNGNDYPQNYKYNSCIYQVGKTMFYFKYYDQNKKIAHQQFPALTFRKDLSVDPTNERLAYITWKGTTIHRKTMNESHIEKIPREFIDNSFTFGKGTINKLSKLNRSLKDFEEEESDNPEDDPRIEQSPSVTLKNSFDGENPTGLREKVGKTTYDNITEMQDYDVNKSLGQNMHPKSMLQSNRKSDQEEDDEIADLPKGDKALNSRSPFKTQNQQQQEQSNEMIFAAQGQNEQDEPPVNILRAINKDQGRLMSNHKAELTKPRIEEFTSNQSFNPNQPIRRYDNTNNLENILSSQQDFASSQEYGLKRSGPLSIGQSPQSQPNFKQVRNIEIKDRIARINEASASDDETPVSQPHEEGMSQQNFKQEPMIKSQEGIIVKNQTQTIEKSAKPIQNLAAPEDPMQRRKSQQAAATGIRASVRSSLEEDANGRKLIVLNDQASEAMIEAVSKQQFLSIRDIGEENKKGGGDTIDSQIQNYSSQLDARKSKDSQQPEGSLHDQALANATSNLLAANMHQSQPQTNQKHVLAGQNSESASFGGRSMKLPVDRNDGGANRIAQVPISKVGLSEYGSLGQPPTKLLSPGKQSVKGQDLSLEKKQDHIDGVVEQDQDQAQMGQDLNPEMEQQNKEGRPSPAEDSSENQIRS